MPPTGPRVMDSPIRPSPPGLERRWKAPGRGHKFFLGCQSLVSGPLGHFPSVIILLASRWPDLTTLLLSFFLFLLSLRFLFASFYSFPSLFLFLFLSCNLSPFPTVSSPFISLHILASFFLPGPRPPFFSLPPPVFFQPIIPLSTNLSPNPLKRQPARDLTLFTEYITDTTAFACIPPIPEDHPC